MRGRYAVISVVAAFAVTACDRPPTTLPAQISSETAGIQVVEPELLSSDKSMVIEAFVANDTSRRAGNFEFACKFFDRGNRIVADLSGKVGDLEIPPHDARQVDVVYWHKSWRVPTGTPARWACVLKAKFGPEGPGGAK